MSNGAQNNVVPKNPRDPETGMTSTEPKPKYTLLAKIPIPSDTEEEDGDIILSDRLSGVGDGNDGITRVNKIVAIDDIKEHAKKSPTKQPIQSAGRQTRQTSSSTGSTEDDGSTTQVKPKYTLMAKVPIPDTDDDDDGIILSDRLSGSGDNIVINDTKEHAKKSPTKKSPTKKSPTKKSPTKQPSHPAGRQARQTNSSTGSTEDDGSTTQAKPKYTLMAKIPIPDTDDDDDGIILSDRLSGV